MGCKIYSEMAHLKLNSLWERSSALAQMARGIMKQMKMQNFWQFDRLLSIFTGSRCFVLSLHLPSAKRGVQVLRTLLLALVCATGSYGEGLLVRTAALSVSGVSTQSYLHLIPLDDPKGGQNPLRLPAPFCTGEMRVTTLGKTVVLRLDYPNLEGPYHEPSVEQSYLMGVAVSPFYPVPNGRISSPRGWQLVDTALYPRPGDTGDLCVLLMSSATESNSTRGRLEVYNCDPLGAPYFSASPKTWPLHITPVGLCMLRDQANAAILGIDRAQGKSRLQFINLLTGIKIHEDRDLLIPRQQFGGVPHEIALSADGAYLFVLTSGYATDAPSGQAVSWVHVFDTTQLNEIGPPVDLVGVPTKGDRSLYPAADSTCWVASRTPGTDFGYVSNVGVWKGVPKLVSHVPIVGVNRSLRLAPAPTGNGLAVAWDEHMEIWNEGKPGAAPIAYPAPIGAVLWESRGVFLGEGGRIHKISPATGESFFTVQLQSGQVTGLILAPTVAGQRRDTDRHGVSDVLEAGFEASPTLRDRDGAQIPHTLDPAPVTASPRFSVPARVTFRGEAVGHELRTVVLDTPYGKGRKWWLNYDDSSMPWLRIYPLKGVLPDSVFLGIDPAVYQPLLPVFTSGKVSFHLEGEYPGMEASGSPANIDVRITPVKSRLRRILWILSQDAPTLSVRSTRNPHELGAVVGLLSGPPHHFTHQEVTGPIETSLHRYAIIALETRAAAQGAMTRHVILDYVAQGGALLLIGQYDTELDSSSLARWLAPVGVRISPNENVSGRFESRSDHELCRFWKNLDVRDGCGVYVDRKASILVPVSDSSELSVFSQFAYGLGRIVVLAASTPLERASIHTGVGRAFASSLFEWLARSRKEIDDQDGDGLPDGLEDSNNNGIRDPGETDHLSADTDEDGIPDGFEDINRNGQLDDGETSPLNRDSDGDGIADGADARPLPPVDAPVIVSLEPNVGPAEGGTLVILEGRNFTADTSVWFGERRSTVRRASATRLVVVAPPAPDSADTQVGLSVMNADTESKTTLPKGFRYGPLSVARLSLVAQNAYELEPGIYAGRAHLRIRSSRSPLGGATLIIQGRPKEMFLTMKLVWSEDPRDQVDGLRGTELTSSSLRINLAPGIDARTGQNLALIEWTAVEDAKVPSIQLIIKDAQVAGPNGTFLATQSIQAVVHLSGPVRLYAP